MEEQLLILVNIAPDISCMYTTKRMDKLICRMLMEIIFKKSITKKY